MLEINRGLRSRDRLYILGIPVLPVEFLPSLPSLIVRPSVPSMSVTVIRHGSSVPALSSRPEGCSAAGSPSFLSALQSVSRVTPAARAMLFLINSLLSPLLMRGLFSTRMAQQIRPATQTLPTSSMHH
jgi:hypothetical protein